MNSFNEDEMIVFLADMLHETTTPENPDFEIIP